MNNQDYFRPKSPWNFYLVYVLQPIMNCEWISLIFFRASFELNPFFRTIVLGCTHTSLLDQSPWIHKYFIISRSLNATKEHISCWRSLPVDQPHCHLYSFFSFSSASLGTLLWWFVPSLGFVVGCQLMEPCCRFSCGWLSVDGACKIAFTIFEAKLSPCFPTAHGRPHQPELGGSQLRYWGIKSQSFQARHSPCPVPFWVNVGPLPDQQCAYNAVILGDDAVPLQGSRLLILLKPGVIVFLAFSHLVTSYTENQQQQHNNNAHDETKHDNKHWTSNLRT